MNGTFVDVSLVIVLATALGIAAHLLRQPTIVAYLITGIIVSAIGALRLNSKEVLDVMATFGITFLLFLVGLEMKFKELRTVGKAILFTGFGQIIFTAIIGFGITKLLGFSNLIGFYIAVALTFSSTIIVVKLLTEKRDMQSLYGRIVIGFLLLQDLISMLILIVLASLQQSSGQSFDVSAVLLSLGKAALLFSATIWLSRKIIPRTLERLSHNQELLFISSIAWAFGIALFVSSPLIGFSIEIGGFLAGLALAQSAEQFQINSRIRPLRDFFILIFFIVLGSTLVVNDIGSILVPIIVLTLFIAIGNPLIVMIIMGMLGYRKRTSFMASVTVAQVSEFSFILIALAKNIGHVDSNAVTIVTVVGIITIVISTYTITHSERIFEYLKPLLSVFEKKYTIEKSAAAVKRRQHFVIAGAHRMGQYLLKKLPKNKTVVIEFDPVIAAQLQHKGYHVIFGDILDKEVLDDAKVLSADLVISTIPFFEDNQAIIKYVGKLPKTERPTFVVNAQHEWEAKKYYAEGADYVLFPHFVGAEHIIQLLKNGQWDRTRAEERKKHDLNAMKA